VLAARTAQRQSWFYKWRDRPPTPRQDRRIRLADAVCRVFEDSGGTYGSPRIGDELRDQGWQVSDNTIAAVMAELGLVARAKRRRRGLTRPGKRPAAPDLIKRRFTAPAPDVAWCGDMTEISTDEGKLYLATVIDLYSRRILGYAMGAHHDAGLVVAALNMAAVTRGGDIAAVIFHSDLGSEYTSADFAKACARWRVRHPNRSPDQDRHLDHRFLQPAPPALHLRRPLTNRLRTINCASSVGSSRIREPSTLPGD
jgi:putative transposase